MDILWFKRDLRVQDNVALVGALQSSKQNSAGLLPLYIIEPQAWQQPDASYRQWQFVVDCLETLNRALTEIGQPLQVYVGNADEIFQTLTERYQINALWSHQETGNAWSFKRDIAVKKWCHAQNIRWHQPPQHPIQRGTFNRDEYGQLSNAFFNTMPLPAPKKSILKSFFAEHTFSLDTVIHLELPLTYWANENTQRGGRHRAEKALNSFLQSRSERYLQTIAKPLTAPRFSSRLSPHLAWGTLSIREVMTATEHAIADSQNAFNKRNLQAFYQRLHWQSHFMQKLESEPEIEFTAMHPLFNNLRPWNEQAEQHFEAWKTGQTGYPMVDACMRSLIQTGWLPFRMRAMVMSFASYQLWLPWQKTAPFLASLFTDYEPGIHYSQVQMQSGVTGINQMRVYNPVKQSHDQDPTGQFIKQWCPELRALSPEEIHAPWLTDNELFASKVELGVDYPLPIVDNDTTARFAKQTLSEVRKQLESKELSRAVFIKHGSRRKLPKKTSNKKKTTTKRTKKREAVPDNQLALF
ncbi:MAG: deoxyribodipyrimidine photo-lyase [Thiotrichales bacterium]|nr:deoxyribodipyrimidine photo-lyase [Thiotrichales bacterium]